MLSLFFFLKPMRSKVCYPNNLGYGANPWSVVDAPRGQSLKANWLSLSQELPAFNSLQVGVGFPAHCPPFTLGLWMVWAFVTTTLSSYIQLPRCIRKTLFWSRPPLLPTLTGFLATFLRDLWASWGREWCKCPIEGGLRSLPIGQSWVSVLITLYHKKLLWWDWQSSDLWV